MKALLLAFSILACSSILNAQEPTPFRWTEHAQIPARISDIGVGVNIARDAWTSFHGDTADKVNFACRVGLAEAAHLVTTAIVHRWRPNLKDDNSFFSGHTSMATATAHDQLGASIAVSVGWGRQAAGYHFGSDVAVGAFVGVLVQKVCP